MNGGKEKDPSEQSINEGKKYSWLWTILASGLVSVVVAFLTAATTAYNAEQEFMRTERSQVYGEYMQATLAYQNALIGYAFIIPVSPGVDREPILPERAGPAYDEVLASRETYLNTRTRARLLQEEPARELQQQIDDKLSSVHEQLEVNATLNLMGRADLAITNQEMRNLAGYDFNVELSELRDQYVDKVRADFHDDSFWSRLVQGVSG